MAAQLRFLNPKTISKPPGYTHVVEATGPGRIVYIAGQLGLDVGGKVVGQAGDFRAQAIQTFENLKIALAEVGATFKDVVKINNYLVDLPGHLPIFREVRDMHLDIVRSRQRARPSRSAHWRARALLETEAIAILPRLRTSQGRRNKAPAQESARRKSAPRRRSPPRRRRR